MKLDDIWRIRDFELPEPQPDFCVYAAQFHEWVARLCAEATKDPTDISINRAKLLLQDRYWAWYDTVPKAHQDHIGNRSGHFCIWQVYRTAYTSLRAVELSITTPPRFFEPPPPPSPPPPPQIAGVFIGEVLDELEEQGG